MSLTFFKYKYRFICLKRDIDGHLVFKVNSKALTCRLNGMRLCYFNFSTTYIVRILFDKQLTRVRLTLFFCRNISILTSFKLTISEYKPPSTCLNDVNSVCWRREMNDGIIISVSGHCYMRYLSQRNFEVELNNRSVGLRWQIHWLSCVLVFRWQGLQS